MDLLARDDLLLALVVACFLPNEIWRWAGLFVSDGLDPDSEIFVWVRYVAMGIVAGLCARLIVEPPGALAEFSMLARLTATGCGIVIFYMARRTLLFGIVGAVAVLGLFGFS